MKVLSTDTENLLKTIVLPALNIQSLDEKVMGTVANYIFNELLLPLAAVAKPNHKEKKMIAVYKKAIEEIQSLPFWDERLSHCLIRKSSIAFINETILPKMGLKELTNDNYDKVAGYIEEHFETPLSQKLQDGKLSEYEKTILKISADAITDLTSDIVPGQSPFRPYSPETETIIHDEVLPKLGYKAYDKTNIGEISEYIFNELEGPLADKAAEEKLSKEEQAKLDGYAKAVTEITTRIDFK